MASNERPQSFIFLDSRTNNKKAVRSFINVDRSRRNAQQRLRTTRSTAPMGWAVQPKDKTPSLLDSHLSVSGNANEAPYQGQQDDSDGSEPSPASSTSLVITKTGANQMYQGVQSLLNTAEREVFGIDPFANLSIRLGHRSQALYHFSIALLAEDEYSNTYTNVTMHRENGVSPHYSSETRLCTMLAQASTYLDFVTGKGMSTQTMWWRTAIIRCLNRLIRDPLTRYSDETLEIIETLLLFESLVPGSKQKRIHSRAMVQLQSHRKSDVFSSPSLDNIHVSLLIVSSKAQIAYLDRPLAGAEGIDEAHAWKKEVDFFITTLKEITSWRDRVQDACYSNPFPIDFMLLQCIQYYGKPLDDFEASNQMFVLCYLALSLIGCRDHQDCRVFLQLLSAPQKLILRPLPPSRQLTDAVWYCIRGVEGYENWKREAIRLIRVFHRLSSQTQTKVKSSLIGVCETAGGLMPTVVMVEEDYTSITDEALAGLPGVS